MNNSNFVFYYKRGDYFPSNEILQKLTPYDINKIQFKIITEYFDKDKIFIDFKHINSLGKNQDVINQITQLKQAKKQLSYEYSNMPQYNTQLKRQALLTQIQTTQQEINNLYTNINVSNNITKSDLLKNIGNNTPEFKITRIIQNNKININLSFTKTINDPQYYCILFKIQDMDLYSFLYNQLVFTTDPLIETQALIDFKQQIVERTHNLINILNKFKEKATNN